MNEIHIYADRESMKHIRSDTDKVILMGGNFGYSNFGDILQLKGSIALHKLTNLDPVPVFATDAISDPDFPLEIGTDKRLLLPFQR